MTFRGGDEVHRRVRGEQEHPGRFAENRAAAHHDSVFAGDFDAVRFQQPHDPARSAGHEARQCEAGGWEPPGARRAEVAVMTVMSIARFERFFRTAAGLDVDKKVDRCGSRISSSP